MFNTILLRLLKKRPATTPVAAQDDQALVELEAAEERLLGCGWFDSSHELQCGLVVTEHSSADAVASDLPLSDWLGMHLAGWQAAASAEPCLA